MILHCVSAIKKHHLRLFRIWMATYMYNVTEQIYLLYRIKSF